MISLLSGIVCFIFDAARTWGSAFVLFFSREIDCLGYSTYIYINSIVYLVLTVVPISLEYTRRHVGV